MRFFAGVPLVGSSGHRLGMLIIIDQQPRRITADKVAVLVNMSGGWRQIPRKPTSADLPLHPPQQKSIYTIRAAPWACVKENMLQGLPPVSFAPTHLEKGREFD